MMKFLSQSRLGIVQIIEFKCVEEEESKTAAEWTFVWYCAHKNGWL